MMVRTERWRQESGTCARPSSKALTQQSSVTMTETGSEEKLGEIIGFVILKQAKPFTGGQNILEVTMER